MSSSERLPDRRLRVVRLLPVLDFGGVESRVILQCRMLDGSAIDLRVCAFHKSGAAARTIRDAGVPVDILDTDPAVRNPGATRALRAYLKSRRPDIVHSSIAEANFHNLLVGRLPRSWSTIAEEVGIPEHGPLARAAFRWLYAAADAVVGVTRATCEYLTRTDRAPSERVHLVYNCAGPQFFPEPVRPRTAYEGGALRVLLVGRLVPVKNHDTFLRAFAEFVKRGAVATLTIAGDGPLAAPTRDLCRDLGIEHHVRLLGFRTDVQALLADADLFALPSHQEGCSISLVEALASGVPAIGSRVPGIIEVLGPLAERWTTSATDQAGWVELLERFRKLNTIERARIGAEGQAIAYERFSPSVYVKNLAELYADVAARRASALS